MRHARYRPAAHRVVGAVYFLVNRRGEYLLDGGTPRRWGPRGQTRMVFRSRREAEVVRNVLFIGPAAAAAAGVRVVAS